MSDFLVIFFISLPITIVPPMLYSLSYFFAERKGSLSKKVYLRFIILFIIFDSIFYIFILLDNYIFKEYYNQINNLYNILSIILFIIYIIYLKKYFSFNDINLFYIINIILIIIKISITNNNNLEEYFYNLIFYFFFSVPLCWILFFINIFVQNKNSRKRKNQSQSDANLAERDAKEEG